MNDNQGPLLKAVLKKKLILIIQLQVRMIEVARVHESL